MNQTNVVINFMSKLFLGFIFFWHYLLQISYKKSIEILLNESWHGEFLKMSYDLFHSLLDEDVLYMAALQVTAENGV